MTKPVIKFNNIPTNTMNEPLVRTAYEWLSSLKTEHLIDDKAFDLAKFEGAMELLMVGITNK